MKSAWIQIEKQLDESPEPLVVARQILKKFMASSEDFTALNFSNGAPILGSLFFNSIIQKF